MADNDLHVLLILLLVTALILSLAVIANVATSYTSAYLSAPTEIATFVDAVDFSIQENESYDQDIARVQRLEDKMRLVRLLREIQRCGDDLREELNGLLIEESSTRLRSSSRLFWAGKRGRLEDRVRRLDLLRMRFLVVYLGLVAGKSGSEAAGSKSDPEKHVQDRHVPKMALRPSLSHALTEGITRKPPPLRRLTTQAMGHTNDSIGIVPKIGWAGVIQELQRSPVMHKRHASIERSIETAMARPP